MDALATLPAGVAPTGVFERTLPPRAKLSYNPGYELGLEIVRWFHYRYNYDFQARTIFSVQDLESQMVMRYRTVLKPMKKYWHLVEEPVVMKNIREFKDLFQDVLAEIEFTK